MNPPAVHLAALQDFPGSVDLTPDHVNIVGVRCFPGDTENIYDDFIYVYWVDSVDNQLYIFQLPGTTDPGDGAIPEGMGRGTLCPQNVKGMWKIGLMHAGTENQQRCGVQNAPAYWWDGNHRRVITDDTPKHFGKTWCNFHRMWGHLININSLMCQGTIDIGKFNALIGPTPDQPGAFDVIAQRSGLGENWAVDYTLIERPKGDPLLSPMTS